MKNNYVVKKVYRSFVLVSILTALTATLGILIDNIIVGRFLGVEALGAMGVVGPISLIFSAFSNICSGGGAARASQAIGRGEHKQVNLVFTVTMLFIAISGYFFPPRG
jgi:Na+-driven multidrug efflux pump